MAETAEDLRELVTELSRRLLEEHMRNVASHNEVRQLVAEGVIDQATVDKAYLEYVRLEGGRFRQLAAEMSVRYYSELARLGTDWSRGFYERLISELREPPATSAPAQPSRVELSAPVGEWAGTIFEVSNDSSDPVQVTFVTSPFRGPAGEVFRPVMTLEPASLVLAPGAAEKISLRVLLEAGLFEAGRIYTSTVEVDGLPGLALILSVWAQAPQVSQVSLTPAEPPVDQRLAEDIEQKAAGGSAATSQAPEKGSTAPAGAAKPRASSASRSRSAARSPSHAARTKGSRARERSPDRT